MPPSMHEISQAARQRADETKDSRRLRIISEQQDIERQRSLTLNNEFLSRLQSVQEIFQAQQDKAENPNLWFAENWFKLEHESPGDEGTGDLSFFGRVSRRPYFAYEVEVKVVLPGEGITDDDLPIYTLAEIKPGGVFVPSADGELALLSSKEDPGYADIDNVISTIERNAEALAREQSIDGLHRDVPEGVPQVH